MLTGPLAGSSYELPHLGKFSWENNVAHPDTSNKTVVAGLEDGTPGSVYIYIGDKRSQGNPVERAGLVGGKLYGVKITDGGSNYGNGAVVLDNAGAINGRFTLADVSAAVPNTGAALQAATIANGVTEFARPEDAAWDPTNRNALYFVTTGATVRAGTPFQFDNIIVDGRGHVLVQEDPGNAAYIAKTWDIDPAAKTGITIFESDRDRFDPAVALPLVTQDEESSGIVEITDLVKSAWWYQRGRRYYLADMQAHNAIGGELVEGGQRYMLISPRE